MIRRFSLALAALTLLSPPVAAQQPWQGFYIGAGGGHSTAATTLDLNVPGPGSVLNLDNLGAGGWVGEAIAGYDLALGNTPFRAGLFVSYAGLGKSEFSFSSPAAGISLADATFEKEINVGARFGYAMNDAVLLYAGGYWARADMSWSLANGALTGSEKLTGKGFMVGAEMALTPYVSVDLQWKRTMYDTVSYDIGGANLNLDTDVDTVMAHVKLRFSGTAIDLTK